MHQRVVYPLSIIASVLLFAGVGMLILTHSHAATPNASVEAENGTIGSPAATVSDAAASGGSAVIFKSTSQLSNPCSSYPLLPTIKPDATNSGVPAGTPLVAAGAMVITTAGTVVDAKDVTGGIVINANNVTIQNSKIHSPGGPNDIEINIGDGVTGTKILHSEIYTTTGGYIGIEAGNTTVCGNYIHGFENGMTVGGGMII